MLDKGFVDLHMHSNLSDGVLTPTGLVKKAADLGLRCIALTDHDTVKGLAEAISAGSKYGVEIISGLEVSTCFDGRSVHILGYMVGTSGEALKKLTLGNATARLERMRRMVGKINDLGYRVDINDLLEFAQSVSVGRAHLARYLVSLGYFKTIDGVFNQVLGDGKPAFEPVQRFSSQQAIRLIEECGGISSLAHPGNSFSKGEINTLVDAGLDAIEVFTPYHTSKMRKKLFKISQENGLIVTGGTDFHGYDRDINSLGAIRLPYWVVSGIKRRVSNRVMQ